MPVTVKHSLKEDFERMMEREHPSQDLMKHQAGAYRNYNTHLMFQVFASGYMQGFEEGTESVKEIIAARMTWG